MSKNISQVFSRIWSVADQFRGHFDISQYGRICLLFTLIRRLECVLKPTKDHVISEYKKHKSLNEDVDERLQTITGARYYNTSSLDLMSLDQNKTSESFNHYINSFNHESCELLKQLGVDEYQSLLNDEGLLFPIAQYFGCIDLSRESLSNDEMAELFQEIIKRFWESSIDTIGEYFTPPDITNLISQLVITNPIEHSSSSDCISLYDPTAGTGGFLTACTQVLNQAIPESRVEVFGEELIVNVAAMCKAVLLIREGDPSKIIYGNTLVHDGFPEKKFDYMLCSPPWGASWKIFEKEIKQEHKQKGFDGRFGPGLPRSSDSGLLFLLHLVSKMKDSEEGGSKIAVVVNGSPLIVGSAKSGESDIRKYLLENDLIECVVSLPGSMFYNTSIETHVLILSNVKHKNLRNRIKLINASKVHSKIAKRKGSKTNVIDQAGIDEVLYAYTSAKPSRISRIVQSDSFFYRDVPLAVAENPEAHTNLKLRVYGAHQEHVRLETDKMVAEYRPDIVFDWNASEMACAIDVNEFWSLEELKQSTSKNPQSSIPGLALIRSIERLVDSDDADENSNLNILYLQMRGKLQASLSASSQLSQSNPALAIEVDPAYSSPEFMAVWINITEVGFQTVSMKNSTMVSLKSIPSLLATDFHLPDLAAQEVFLEGLQRLNEGKSKLKELEDVLLRDIYEPTSVIKDLESIKFGYTYDDWIESLPFPLASILWRHKSLGEKHRRKLDTLIDFFEALAAFIATTHLSAFKTNPDQWEELSTDLNRKLAKQGLSFERATIGSWKLIAEVISGRCRNLFSPDGKNDELLSQMYGCEDIEIVEMLCSSKVLESIQYANKIRNSHTAHGGVLSDEKAQRNHDKLFDTLILIREAFGIQWANYELLQPGKMTFSDNKFSYDAKRLVGSRSPFEVVNRLSLEAMKSDNLYLVNGSGVYNLELMPFVKVMPSPEIQAEACFIFNKREGENHKYVSYHFEQESSFSDQFEEVDIALESLAQKETEK